MFCERNNILTYQTEKVQIRACWYIRKSSGYVFGKRLKGKVENLNVDKVFV